ncbi:MAG: hypothetical protein ACPGYV_14250 [Phycisphaeraceae bacterium]
MRRWLSRGWWVGVVAAAAMAGAVSAQDLGSADGIDSRFQEDQRIEADTLLGRFTLGVSGINDNERRNATGGDVEFGYLYQFAFDEVFPRVVELRPFVFNRAESTDASYYESLGLGAGLRLNWREAYETKNWFVRVSVLTPTDAYRERFDLDRDQASVAEVFAGYEIPFRNDLAGRDMRARVMRVRAIELAVPGELFAGEASIDDAVLARVRGMIVGAYLLRVFERVGGRGAAWDPALSDWPAIQLIQGVTDRAFPLGRYRALHPDVIPDPGELAARRRELVTGYLRQGLVEMMRGPYPLILKPMRLGGSAASLDADAIGDADGRADAPLVSDAETFPVGLMARPGMRLTPGRAPLDADAMIEAYIRFATSSIR